MLSTFVLILPDFLLIALGWVLFRSRWLPADFFPEAEKLVYYVLFPALLFFSVAQNRLDIEQLSTLGLAAWVLATGGVVLVFLARPILRPEAVKYRSIAQCSYRFNTYIALSIAVAFQGQEGLGIMALYVALSVPLVNVIAVYSLAQNGQTKIVTALLRNPLILSTLGGLIWSYTGWSLPAPVHITLDRLGASALPLGLLCVGASLSIQAIHGAKALLSWVLAVRLLLMPVIALGLNLLLPLAPIEQQMLLLFAAVPTAPASYVLAVRMGGDGPLAALTLSLSTILSAITLPLWMMISY